MMMMLIFVGQWGNYTVLGNVLSILFGQAFTPTQVSEIGAVYILVGLVGCQVLGAIVEKTQAYRAVIRCICLITPILFAGFTLTYNLQSFYLMLVLGGIAGFFNVAIFPISMAYAVKTAPNDSAATANGFLALMAQLYSAIVTILITYLINIAPQWGTAFMGFICLFTFIASLFLKANNVEDKKSKEAKGSEGFASDSHEEELLD